MGTRLCRCRLRAGLATQVRGFSWGCFDADTLAFLERGGPLPSPEATGASTPAPTSAAATAAGAAAAASAAAAEARGPRSAGLGFDVVLGADCFYSSEAFDSVLATAHWVLHRPWSTARDIDSDDGSDARAPHSDAHSDEPPPPAPGRAAATANADHAPLPRPPRSPELPPLPLRPRQFLVTYQERSAGRNVRALLKKWRLRGEAVPLNAFMPTATADDPRFASIHMLVLTPAL